MKWIIQECVTCKARMFTPGYLLKDGTTCECGGQLTFIGETNKPSMTVKPSRQVKPKETKCEHNYRVLTDDLRVTVLNSGNNVVYRNTEGLVLFYCTKCLDVEEVIFP